MTFPSGTISADDIRYQLAYNNTAGAQTPVTLNDLPVRQAADKLTGTVSYNDLRGKNVFFSGTITWGVGASFGKNYYGYSAIFYPIFGSVNTTSYYRLVSTSGAPAAQTDIIYTDDYESGYSNTQIAVSFLEAQVTPAITSPYVNVYIDGVKYALTADAYGTLGWFWNYTDPLGLAGRVGQTNQVVITY